jgi:hypothetical protein
MEAVPHETYKSQQDPRKFKITTSIMSMSKLLSKSAVRAASTVAQTTKAAGDISSVFPSLRADYKPEPLPPRFAELKEKFFNKNKYALTRSWERLLPSLDTEVQKIKAQGSDVCRHP